LNVSSSEMKKKAQPYKKINPVKYRMMMKYVKRMAEIEDGKI